MASSDIDMVSNALVLLGHTSISAFSEAADVTNLYPSIYEAVLSEHNWSFALKEQPLSRLAEELDPEVGFRFAFQAPPDMIRVWKVIPFSDYKPVGSLIYSNQTALLARYIFRVPEVNLPPHFVLMLQYKLASDFAVSVTEDPTKEAAFQRKYIDQLIRAKNIDAQGRTQEAIFDSPFIRAHDGGG